MGTKNKLKELEAKVLILEDMVKRLWRESHPLDKLEVVGLLTEEK